jgi:multiple sugar transport system substrate-binding protein
MKKNIFIFSILMVFLLTFLSACGCGRKSMEESVGPITLNYWRVFDGRDDFAEIIARYNQRHPYITINYRKLRYDEYEEALLHALAEDRGPDIFSIHNTWTRKYESKIEPMPEETVMVFPVTRGTIKEEIVPERRTIRSLNLRDLRQRFADVVYSDVVINDKIYGLPLSVDTLAMYYNQDLFDQAGIVSVPSYWNREFQETVKNLTRQDLRGNIIQSGVALGTSENIERHSDILSVLMMQNGADMMNEAGQVLFHTIPSWVDDKNYNPGMMALRFYTDFANPVKEVYSWNNNMDSSVSMFASGKLAMMFAYSYHLPVIESLSPKLNFFVSPLPQIEGSGVPVNFANYWLEVVSNKSDHKNEAWNFVQFMTSPEQASLYLNKTKKPAALRSLIPDQRDDLDIGVFADQVLTSRSWYKGKNPLLMERFFGEMIEQVLKDTEEEIINIMNLYANRIQQTVR